MQVRKLDGAFGAKISRIDIARADDETIGGLVDLLYQDQILVIRRQSLSAADYVRFGHAWGRPLRFFVASRRRDDFPELIKQDNSPETPVAVRDGASHWHSDSVYEEVPARVTMLYGVEAPDHGGKTLVTNLALAYEALSAEMKARIEGLVGLHSPSGGAPLEGETFAYVVEEIARMGVQRHPVVLRHPITGAKSLYLSGSAFGIDGMDKGEGKALVSELRAHATRPEFVTRYKVVPGEIFIWDNFATMRRATSIEYSDKPGKRRLLYRLSPKGLPSRYAAQEAA